MLKMKRIKYILSITVLLTLGTACTEDFVTLDNPNAFGSSSFWKTGDDALAGVNAVYNTLYYDGLYMRLYLWIMDVRADDFRNTSPWWITAVSVYQTSPDNPCYYTSWQHLYTGIWRANQVLDNVPGIDMDETLKARIIAEAKFLRALYYFHLVIIYKNVPLITTSPIDASEYYPSQTPVADVWAQIIQDFTDAKTVLPKKEDYASEDLGRATKAAAAGYLAKSLMWNQRWNEAATELKPIIDQELGSYSLVADYRDNFTEANENNSESLFEVQFDRNVGGTTLGWVGEPQPDWSKTSGKARTYAPLGFGWGDITPTDWIYNEFMLEKTTDGQDDPRLKASAFYDYPGVTVYGKTWEVSGLSNLIYVRKYLNDDTYPDETEWRSGINERILRYDDILLLYAECLNEQGQTDEAYPYIQEVRDRADLPDLATTKPGLSQEEMRSQLSHERALEFCFEAQRYPDLLRWGWFDDTDRLVELQSHDEEISLWTAGREYMAIPQTELDQNPNLVQNPGW
jgi:hypothetical protein